MANWYYEKDGSQHGPVAPKKLKELADSGVLSPEDRVRSEDNDWRQANLVKGLFTSEKLSSPPSSPSPPSPASQPPEKSLSKKIGEAGKAMAQRTAKQAERTKLKSVSLPYAYSALGKFVLADGKLRSAIPELFAEADGLNGTIDRLKKEIAERPTGEDLTSKAKSIAFATKDKAEIQARQLQLSRLATKVGEVAFENHKSAGEKELVANIVKIRNRIEELDAEVETLSSGESFGMIRRSLLQNKFVLAALSFCCFPIGLWLVWKNPQWQASTKWKWTGATFAVLFLLFAFGKYSENQSLKQLAEANTQWTTGNKDAAISTYKQMTEYGPSSVPASERSLVYGRLIESDLEHGMDQSARNHAEKAISHGFEPSLNSIEAKSLVREIREARNFSESQSREQTVAIDKRKEAEVTSQTEEKPNTRKENEKNKATANKRNDSGPPRKLARMSLSKKTKALVDGSDYAYILSVRPATHETAKMDSLKDPVLVGDAQRKLFLRQGDKGFLYNEKPAGSGEFVPALDFGQLMLRSEFSKDNNSQTPLSFYGERLQREPDLIQQYEIIVSVFDNPSELEFDCHFRTSLVMSIIRSGQGQRDPPIENFFGGKAKRIK